jgi:hypothetical protein
MSPKNKIRLSLIIFSLFSITLITFVVFPLFSGIKKSSQNLISQRQTFASFEARIENIGNFKDIYQKIEPNLKISSTFFVNSEVPVEFISFLETTAKDCQVSINISSAIPGETKEEIWPSLVFRITSISSFPKFLRFLEKLETCPYLIQIQNLQISRLTNSEHEKQKAGEFSLGDVSTSFSIKVLTK